MVAFTLFHVAISLVAILAGFSVALGLLKSERKSCTTALFLITTAATSVTGFLFPVHRLMPSHILGVISLVSLSITALALYKAHLAGAWRWVYAGGAVFSLYLNFFVLIAQAFAKVPALKALAPTQSEPPFQAAEGVALVSFLILGIAAAVRFRPVTPAPSAGA